MKFHEGVTMHSFLIRIIKLGPIVVLSCALFTASCSKTEKKPDYLGIVKRSLDTMLKNGRDVHGGTESPLFATTLDRKSLRIFEGGERDRILAIPHSEWGIRPHDRMVQGGNPMHDQNLYHVLYALSEITGDTRYGEEADRTLAYFLKNCQSKETGLFAWGEHIGWDFETESIIQKDAGTTHEFARPWLLWERSFRLAPEACRRFASGLWEHQVGDRRKALYSRHARYDRHGPGTGSEYPRHGGFYIATWAAAYEETNDPVYLEAIESLVNGFEARRNTASGGIMAETISPELMWPLSNVSLAIDLWESAALVPNALSRKMRSLADELDSVFLKTPHDLSPEGRGFIISAVTSTLEPGWMRGGVPDTTQHIYTETWATEYGAMTDAQAAMICLLRYRQTDNRGYKKLFLGTACRYLTNDPDTTIALYPGALGDALAVMLGAYETTGNHRFLQRADELGKMAIDIFFGENPLPRASTKHEHYEAITRGDTLIMELLRLHLALKGMPVETELVYSDR